MRTCWISCLVRRWSLAHRTDWEDRTPERQLEFEKWADGLVRLLGLVGDEALKDVIKRVFSAAPCNSFGIFNSTNSQVS